MYRFLGFEMKRTPPTNIWVLERRTFHAMRLGDDSWTVTTINGQREFDDQAKAEEYAILEINQDVEAIMMADDKLDDVEQAMRDMARVAAHA